MSNEIDMKLLLSLYEVCIKYLVIIISTFCVGEWCQLVRLSRSVRIVLAQTVIVKNEIILEEYICIYINFIHLC